MLEIQFKKFITLQRGFDLPRKDMVEGPYPVVGSTTIVGWHNEYKKEPPGVATGRSGSLGFVQYIKKKYWPHNTSLWVKDFKGNYPKYVYYFLKTIPLALFNSGTGVPTLNRNDLDTYKIRIHDYVEQRKIAGILSAYDEMVENNTRRIKILEEIAPTIYEEWFVKFRYPGHETMQMMDSELGMIPEGWEVKNLSGLVNTQYGYTESAQGEVVGPKYVRGTDINKASYIVWDEVPYCPISEENWGKYKLSVGDVLVIRMADPGKVGIIERNIYAVFASYLIRLTSKTKELSPYYLFYFLSSNSYQNYIAGASTGTTRKSASACVITDVFIAIPPSEVRKAFEIQIAEIRNLMNNLIDQNSTLRQTRDLLLPRLISGEIDVSDLDIKVRQ